VKSLEIKLNEALEQLVTEQRTRAARAEREMRFRGAGLSQSARNRLHLAFTLSTDNAGLKEAINVELRRGTR